MNTISRTPISPQHQQPPHARSQAGIALGLLQTCFTICGSWPVEQGRLVTGFPMGSVPPRGAPPPSRTRSSCDRFANVFYPSTGCIALPPPPAPAEGGRLVTGLPLSSIPARGASPCLPPSAPAEQGRLVTGLPMSSIPPRGAPSCPPPPSQHNPLLSWGARG